MFSFSLRNFFIALVLLFAIISGAVFVFHYVEKFSYLDSLWLTLVSISTVGYGDVVPRTAAGRIAALAVILTGAALYTYVLGTLFVYLVEGQIKRTWVRRKMLGNIAHLSGHVIVCGAGRVGGEVVAKLKYEGARFVVIEKDPEVARSYQEKGFLCLNGDATEEEVLIAAGIERARDVILALPRDGDNLLVAVTCKDLNPAARLIARVTRPDAEKRMRRAGVDVVVCPPAIGGKRMAMVALKPHSVKFIETIFDRPEIDLEIEEIVLSGNSPLAGKRLGESRLREDYDVQLLAIIRGERIIVPPPAAEVLAAGDLLILYGWAAQLKKAAALVSGDR
ncbi:MAG: potassium channel family protein [Desulfotomaculales bacterium]